MAPQRPDSDVPTTPVNSAAPRIPLIVLSPTQRLRDVAPAPAQSGSGDEEAVPGYYGRTLRIALAMRGGVSLAVWIGGVVAELDLLRRIRIIEKDSVAVACYLSPVDTPSPQQIARVGEYAALLARARYDRVDFDLLAGASAGGLNAVMYSVAQRAGTGLDALVGMWRQLGGFWGLLHAPGFGQVDALMRGEDYFRKGAKDALAGLYASTDTHPDLRSDIVSVDLSTTIIDSDDESEGDSEEGRGHFHFIGTATHPYANRIPSRFDTDYPGRDAVDDESLSRLALAARSTSSLPAGFEPAEIESIEGSMAGNKGHRAIDGTGPSVDPSPVPAETGVHRSQMRYAFAAHRSKPGTPYRVVDGAVFDNVPIDRALRAARSRLSIGQADRALLFIDPDPDKSFTGKAVWMQTDGSFWSAIKAFVAKGSRRETVAGETAQIQGFNSDMLVERERRESFAPLVRNANWSPGARRQRFDAYVRSIGGTLARDLSETLARPSLWQLTTLLPERRRYTAIDRELLSGLDLWLSREMRTINAENVDLKDYRAEVTGIGRGIPRRGFGLASLGPLMLADAASCVITWARHLEQASASGSELRLGSLTAIRTAAYTALNAGVVGRDLAIESLLLDADPFARRRMGRPDAPHFRAWLQAWSEPSREADYRSHWRALADCVSELTGLTIAMEATMATRGGPAQTQWKASPLSWLGRAGDDLSPVDLAALFASAGIPPALSRVTYWSIGVTEQPAVASRFTALAEHEWQNRLQTVVRARLATRGDVQKREEEWVASMLTNEKRPTVLSPQTKLSGYGMGNFLGFLSSEWRVNDWWWGRLDAASGIPRFLASLAPNAPDLTTTIVGTQDAVLAEAVALLAVDPSSGAPVTSVDSPFHEDGGGTLPPEDRLRTGTDGLGNLRPDYRVALSNRILRLADRAAVRPAGFVGRALLYPLMALLRPLLVVLPIAADPPRLALLATAIAGAAWWLTWDESVTTLFAGDDPAPAISGTIAVVLAAVVVVSLSVIAVVMHRRWNFIEGIVAKTDALHAKRIKAMRSETRVIGYGAGIASVLSLIPLTIALIRANVVMIVLCLGATLIFVLLTVRLARTIRRGHVTGRRRRIWAMLGVFAVVGAVVPVMQLVLLLTGASASVVPLGIDTASATPGVGSDPVQWPDPGTLVVLVVAAFVAAATALVGWLPVTHRGPSGRRLYAVNWLTVGLASVGFAALIWFPVAGSDGILEPLWQDILEYAVFVIAWANAVWWLPNLQRDTDRVISDRIQRPDLHPVAETVVSP